MFFWKKRKRQSNPTPPWLKWLILAFFGYAVLLGTGNGPQGSRPNPVKEALQKNTAVADPVKFLGYSGLKDKLLPGSQALEIKDIETGKGAPLMCGQEIKIAYDSFLADGKRIDNSASADEPLSFRLGQHLVMPAFERGVVGMLKGGKRSVTAPPMMAYGIKEYARDDVPADATARFEITLIDATPAVPDPGVVPFRVFEARDGNGSVVKCGDEIKIKAIVWSVEGKKLYQTDDAPLSITVGNSDVFLGLEQGVLGMRRTGTRTLLVPPAFQKTMNGNPPIADMHLPPHETVLVDVEALP